ncbi:hypothetical protein GCM10011613_32920 [Cellvibrio zantedeschiae]|uniref:Aminoglycoside phosphotransferase domain-containing protein n=2 Tax=Cellvibrio zantedeschiae TaxID=1237077 RepID=A0ABQ3B962_9GAMM|nr:hypothetical protein GCM10011613_32920 [Cellvibrio zantedeschiae]
MDAQIMSYVIHIWEQPSPATWKEADALQANLVGKKATPNPKFAQLAQQLLRDFPHVRGAQGSPWIEGAPDGQVDEASWALGIDSAQIERVVPVLVTHALALGLTVYDDQAGEAYLPGNWRLSPEGREPLEWLEVAEDSEFERKAKGQNYLEERVRALVLPHFEAHGFSLIWRRQLYRHDALSLIRQTPLGEQRIQMIAQQWSDNYWDLWLDCEIAPRLPQDLLDWSKPQDHIRLVWRDLVPLKHFARWPETPKPFDSLFRCWDRDQLENFLTLYAAWAKQELLPLLDRCKGLRGYLEVDCEETNVMIKATMVGLALAHCAGDPALAERAERYGLQRSPNPRQHIFQQAFEELAAFPQYFGAATKKR